MFHTPSDNENKQTNKQQRPKTNNQNQNKTKTKQKKQEKKNSRHKSKFHDFTQHPHTPTQTHTRIRDPLPPKLERAGCTEQPCSLHFHASLTISIALVTLPHELSLGRSTRERNTLTPKDYATLRSKNCNLIIFLIIHLLKSANDAGKLIMHRCIDDKAGMKVVEICLSILSK